MATDHIRYDILAQNALRGVVRTVMADAAKKGLIGDHHFKISFDTTAPGVKLSGRLREQYPHEMTIVLQHQFWDLVVSDTSFEVGLAFGGVAERLLVPFDAIKSFFDPSIQFGLQFESLSEAGPAATHPERRDDQPKSKPRAPAQHQPQPAAVPAVPPPVAETPVDDASAKQSGEIVQLDRFRKK
jgi:hypothetical protein